MIIKMTKVACGPDGSFQPGTIREVDGKTGLQLVQAGAAVDLSPKQPEPEAAVIVQTEPEPEPKPEPEAAVAVQPEHAVMPPAKGKRK